MITEKPFSVYHPMEDPLPKMSITPIQTCVTRTSTLEEDIPSVKMIVLASRPRGPLLTFSWWIAADARS
jgi:hypothetical protein